MIESISKNKFTSLKGKIRFLYELFSEDLEQKESFQILSLSESLKTSLNRLNTDDTFKVYYLNSRIFLDSPKEEKVLSTHNAIPLEEGLSPFVFKENFFSDPIFKSDFVKFNLHYFRFVSISLKGDHKIDITGLQKFGDYFVSIKKVKTLFSKMMVDGARKMNHTALFSSLSDIEGIESYKENESMLRKIITREEDLFKTEIFFIVRSETEKDLLEKSKALIKELDEHGLTPKVETIALNQIFKNFIPGIEPSLNAPLLFHTSLLANTIPCHQDKLMQNGVKFHSRSGRDQFIDIRSGESYSACVLGPTGSGKTFTVQKLLTEELKKGVKVLILDPKKDYHKMALLNNAYIIDESINPMIIKDPTYLKNMILSKIPANERNSLFSGKLLRAIRETEAYKENNFFKALELLKKKGFEDLEFYFEDIIDKISERKIDFSDFVYIEFGTFSTESIPFILSFAFEYARRFKGPYDLVVDEAHRIFKHDPSFLEERVREMRVQNASLITITQSYSDLIKNYFGQVVADNSFHKFFFSQNLELGRGIDDFDLERVKNLRTLRGEYSEFYYKSGVHRKVLRYYPTLKEYELFKSGNEINKPMLQFIHDHMKYFSIDECVNQWVRDKYA